jgi:serine/threonine-protein kinase
MLLSFRREAELGARLNHPNIVQVFEVFDRPTGPVMVMEYLEGLSLAEIQKHSELPLSIHLYVLMQTLAGLQHLHEMRGLDGEPLHAVHRDVSPQNIIALHEGVVKVLDFGIAKVRTAGTEATRTGIMKGKVRYMAPEQIVGEKSIDRRADLFAVGILLWEAFAGRRMWGESSNMDVLMTIVKEGVPSIRSVAPDISPAAERLVNRATAAKVQDRYETALEMQVELEQCIAELGLGIQQRQVSEFMATQFGEIRDARKKAVSAALARSGGSSTGVGTLSLFGGGRQEDSSLKRALGLAEHSGEHSMERSSRLAPPNLAGAAVVEPSQVVVQQAPPNRVPYIVAGAAVALALLVGGWALGSRRTPPPSAPVATASALIPHPIHVDVIAYPPAAEIFVDGVRASNPLHTTQDSSTRRAVIEVRAPGYASETHTMSLDSDVALDVKLAPVAGATAAAEEDAAAKAAPPHDAPSQAKAVSAKVTAPVYRAPAAATPATAAAPAPAETKAKSCNPPYTLSADGVKTYKPECF